MFALALSRRNGGRRVGGRSGVGVQPLVWSRWEKMGVEERWLVEGERTLA